MKKFINNPKNFEEDSLRGILAAYPEELQSHPEDIRAIYRTALPHPGKVSIVTAGGYGHLPVFLGYVGEGLCDGVGVGNVFSSPSNGTLYRVSKSVPGENGILYICGNYLGDLMNIEMARETVEEEGLLTRMVVVCDDVASAPRADWQSRRGISGIVFAYKIAGAAAQRLWPLEEVERVTRKANASMASYGVAFEPCQLPNTQRPIFDIGADEMELGIGMHGERGTERIRWIPSREIAAVTVDKLVADLALRRGERVAVLVNGLGATAQEEQFIYYHDVRERLGYHGILTERSLVGEYVTSMEMSGALLTLLRLDEELLELLDAPARSPFVGFSRGIGGFR